MGVFWQQNNYETYSGVYNTTGAICFVADCQLFLNFIPSVIVFQIEKPIYTRERDSGLYDVWVYATAKFIAEQPIMWLAPFIFLILTYFAIGLTDTFTGFLGFYFICMLCVQACTSYAYILSSLFNDMKTAFAILPFINLPMNMLSGFSINLKDIMQETP